MEISVLRNLVIRYGAKLGLKSNQQVCLWHLLDHDFTGKGYVFPSEAKIAERMGLESDRQVRRIIDELESKKYIMVKRTQGFSNRYSFKGITKAVLPFWQEEIKKERERLKKNTPDKNVLSEQDNPGQKCPQPRTKMSAPPGQKCPPKHCNRSTASKHTYPAPQNGASKSVFLEKQKDEKPAPSEKSNYEILLDWWYECKGENNPGTEPARYDRKKYIPLVNERIEDGKTWREISAAVKNYWRVVKSSAHYYKHEGSITWFIAKGIDNFWSELKPWENFKKRDDDKNGKSNGLHKRDNHHEQNNDVQQPMILAEILKQAGVLNAAA